MPVAVRAPGYGPHEPDLSRMRPTRRDGSRIRAGPSPRDGTTLLGWEPVLNPSIQGVDPALVGTAIDNARSACYTPAYGPLAQLVEQGPFKPRVAGSNPARPMYPARSTLGADRAPF